MPPHHHDPHHGRHHHPHHHAGRFLDAVTILVDDGAISTFEQLSRYAEKKGQQAVLEILRSMEHEDDLDLVIRELSLRLERDARKEHKQRMDEWQGRRVAIIFPLPPHVHEPLLTLPEVHVLVARRHHLPPHLRHAVKSAVHDHRSCRQLIGTVDVIVFEGFRDDGAMFVDEDIADILDLRVVPVTTKLFVHNRPHQHPDDVEFDCGSHSISWL
jgi:hypothetical protein